MQAQLETLETTVSQGVAGVRTELAAVLLRVEEGELQRDDLFKEAGLQKYRISRPTVSFSACVFPLVLRGP